jgi:hypothetical protein
MRNMKRLGNCVGKRESKWVGVEAAIFFYIPRVEGGVRNASDFFDRSLLFLVF